MGEIIYIKCWLENLKKRDNLEGLVVNGKIKSLCLTKHHTKDVLGKCQYSSTHS